MKIKILKPRKALNKAFLKVKPNRIEIESFKTNLVRLLDGANNKESEEFHKNLISDFLKDTYYKQNYFINTKGRNDLVIHNGKNANSSVGVIFEVKKPTNKIEMITTQKLDAKAFYELTLYYLRERITNKNIEIKRLIATNFNEWFIFDATLFERLFAQNKEFVKQFKSFETGVLAGDTTDFFYKEIAKPFIENIKTEIEFAYFNLQEYQKSLRNADKMSDNGLIPLFKILSPQHFLKLPFTNDSNSLDKNFYGELLHIIGLSETKKKSKKLIERNKKGKRNSGAILENAIIRIDSLDKIGRLDQPDKFGDTQEERLFNVGLELSITWINRILFLKLLEAQLIAYHKGDKSYSFLNLNKIKDYDDLNSLFFEVLAKKYDKRNNDVKKAFAKIPYLNSSLFELTELEHATLLISNLKDNQKIPIISSTALKNDKGKKLTGNLSTLEYLFKFLDAYDFASEGSEAIQEDNKALINASVLGLIFEKINGYKDGSFFTPGFITMYMCRETIRKSAIQKFNETKKWSCKNLKEIYNKIEDNKEANEIINRIKICDPAVGSGHFLVSALNEIIALKNDLKILQDRSGRRLKEYNVEVVNDELVITDEDGELFEYNYKNKESQRIQETLFGEKKTIIENCLFGVDINPNSVKICRLRLWIELLKNAYYKNADELETLPNIDINIKCGNSLVSRFAIDADLSRALRKSKWNIETYQIAVATYRNAESKEQKLKAEKLINEIQEDFRAEILSQDMKVIRLKKLKGDLKSEMIKDKLFPMSKEDKKDFNEKIAKITEKKERLEVEIKAIKSNKIFKNAFEWRFEFPEVLNDNGDFVGFDIIIGNPPYVNFANLMKIEREYYNKFELYKNKTDLYAFFVGLSEKIKNEKGLICLIIPHTWISTTSFLPLRKLLLKKLHISSIVEFDFGVFKDAYVKTVIIQTDSNPANRIRLLDEDFNLKMEIPKDAILNDQELKINLTWNPIKHTIFNKIKSDATKLGDIIHFSRGIKTSDDKRFLFFENKEENFYKVVRGRNIKAYRIDYNNEFIWYRPDLMKEKAGCLPHTKELFIVSEKIITQRVNSSSQLLATYDNSQHFCLDTTNISSKIIDKNCDLKFIVGVINSKLINWWFNDEFKNPTISGYELHQIPIKKKLDFETKISKIVNEIIIAKQANPQADTTELENQIDRLVYKLYDLTKEEIKIIENSVK